MLILLRGSVAGLRHSLPYLNHSHVCFCVLVLGEIFLGSCL